MILVLDLGGVLSCLSSFLDRDRSLECGSRSLGLDEGFSGGHDLPLSLGGDLLRSRPGYGGNGLSGSPYIGSSGGVGGGGPSPPLPPPPVDGSMSIVSGVDGTGAFAFLLELTVPSLL